DFASFEGQPTGRQVQGPHPGATGAGLRDGAVGVRIQVRAPGCQGGRVVLAQVLGVPDLQAAVVHGRDNLAGGLQLAVREDVAVDEAAGPVGHARVGVGYAVVEQPATGLEAV